MKFPQKNKKVKDKAVAANHDGFIFVGLYD